jgi:D-serine deaminase-like pyridoxal phosphate-dependent protein
MDMNDLPTPALILDRARLARNTQAMTERVRALGVGLRPHMKTAKSADVAGLALEGNFGGITVSTLNEAEYFLEHGITDITNAVCFVPAKLTQAAALIDRGADLKLITDNPGVAKAIAAHPGPAKGVFKVLAEIDCGEHRTGVLPDSPDLLEIAGALTAAEKTEFAGVLTHAGHSYACRTEDDMAAVAEEERAAAVGAAERIAEAGIPCPTVSTGSTPCVMFARDVTGVTEVRPGVYMFGDLFQAGLGTRTIGEIAISVLATVMAHGRDHNQVYIDAGGLAMSKDRATAALDDDCGFGLVCDWATAEPIPGLLVASVHQEHGQVTGEGPVPFDDLPVGSKVRVLPNHVCMTAAAYDGYNVIDGSTEVIATWGRCNGW